MTAGSVTLVVALAVASVLVLRPVASGAEPVGAQPTIRVEIQHGLGGAYTMVQLDGWPFGAVNVAVCGALARRASQDCDLTNAQAVVVPSSGSTAVPLPPLTPPIPCPCVLRVSTLRNEVVHTIPIDIPGVPILTPEQLPADPNAVVPAGDLQVSARLEDRSTVADTLRAAFGGTADRILVVEVRNLGAVAMPALDASAAVGGSTSGGTPVAVPDIEPLAPGAHRSFEVPVTLPAATFGTMYASGAVRGLAAPVPFEAETTQHPWGLVVMAVLVVALVVARRVRRRHRRVPAADPASSAGAPREPERVAVT